MARTPPRLGATFAPRPLARLELRPRPSPEGMVQAPRATLEVLAFGRALDALERDDTDYVLGEPERLRAVARALARVLEPLGPSLQELRARLDVEDPIQLSVAIDQLTKLLSASEAVDRAAVTRSLSLADRLVAALREDAGLRSNFASAILTYAALEAYYYERATVQAKRQFDAFRDLLRETTGRSEDAINQDEELGNGQKLWEGWQAVRGLEPYFDLGELGGELQRRGERSLAELFLGADLLRRAFAPEVDEASLARAVARLRTLSPQGGRELASAPRLSPGARAAPPPRVLGPEPSLEAGTGREPPSPELRATFLPQTSDEREDQRRFRRRGRRTSAIVEDLSSVLERYEILLGGDDNSLVFEIAPMHERSLRELYHEVSVEHPRLEAAIYSGDAVPTPDVLALRSVVRRATSLVTRMRALVEALASSDLLVGPRDEDPATSRAPQSEGPTSLALPRDPLAGLLLEQSIVTGLRSDLDSVSFEVVFALAPDHPRFGEGPQLPGRLHLRGARSIRWRHLHLEPSPTPDGHTSFGVIERLTIAGERSQVSGPWGDVELQGAALAIELPRL